MSEQTDASLVGAALAGEAEPFCALVRRYQDHVYGVALGILADFHLALDAAQEAFLCAYCELAKLKDPARFGGWLCGIARNTAFEVRRGRQRQEALVRQVAQRAGVPDAAPSSEQLAARNEERTLVQQALLGVNDKDREALTLYYADGLSYADICGFLGVSLGTLKGRLQRGRAALRKELTMVEQACKDNAPDESFSQSLERAIRVFSAKGPPANHIPSEWHDAVRVEFGRILAAGDEGFRIAVALSHAGSARARAHAGAMFGFMSDERSLRELERMVTDRFSSLIWYAKRIHPDHPEHPGGAFAPTREFVPGVEHLIKLLDHESFNMRLKGVQLVGAYLPSGNEHVVQAMRKALADPKHKVRHAAARLLHVPCPGCGKTW